MPMPPCGLVEVMGFNFNPEIFDTFGGCSEETAALITEYPKQFAAREGRKPKGVLTEFTGNLATAFGA